MTGADLGLERPLAHGHDVKAGHAVGRDADGGEQVGVALLGAEVGDGAHHHVVGPEAQLGAHCGALGADRPGGVDGGAVHDRLHPRTQADRNRPPDVVGDREVGVVEGEGDGVHDAGREDVAPPFVVLGRHDARPLRLRQRAHDESGHARHHRRVEVDDVEPGGDQQRRSRAGHPTS